MLNTYLDFHEVVTEAVVDTDLRSNHLGEDDGVAEVGLDDLGLAGGVSDSLLGLAEALAEVLEALVVATNEAAAGTGVEHLEEVLLRDIEELLSLDTTEEVLTERLLRLFSLQ